MSREVVALCACTPLDDLGWPKDDDHSEIQHMMSIVNGRVVLGECVALGCSCKKFDALSLGATA